MKVYEINEQYLKFLEMFESGEIDQQTFTDTLESLNADYSDKVSNIVSYIKNLEYEAKAIKEEEKKLADRRKNKENKIDNLKQLVETMMKVRNKSKFENSKFVVSYRKSSSVETDIDFCNSEYIKEEISYKIDKVKLKQDLKEKDIAGARIVVKNNLVIK